MSRNPEDVRREIDRARNDLGVTLEAIGDRVSPKLVKERAMDKVNERLDAVNDRVNPARIVRRRRARMRASLRNVRESVMGPVDGVDVSRAAGSVRGGAQRASRRVGEAAGSLASGASSAPDVVRSRAQGNPLLAGLVAFGGGLIAASALPPTDSERQAAERILEELEPLKEQAVGVGKSVAGELQQSAQSRAERVKQRAASGAERVRSDAQQSGQEVKGRGQGAAKKVQKRAQGAAKKVQKRAQGSTKRVQKRAQGSTKRVQKRAAGQPARAQGAPRRQTRGRRTTTPA